MREIKFRAWNKKEKNFITWDLDFAFGGTGEIWGSVEQYTGLKDNNGKEVYEGDIISFWNGQIIECNDGDLEYDGKIYKRRENILREIVLQGCSFRIKNGNPLMSQHLSSNEIQIVGNIHENPELLDTP